MIRFLKEEFPEECAPLSNDELRESIQRHTEEARPYAIEDENALAKFIYLKWLLGEDFEDLPDCAWLMGLLEDRARPAVERMDVAVGGGVDWASSNRNRPTPAPQQRHAPKGKRK